MHIRHSELMAVSVPSGFKWNHAFSSQGTICIGCIFTLQNSLAKLQKEAQINLTLQMLRLFSSKAQGLKDENHLNPVILVSLDSSP